MGTEKLETQLETVEIKQTRDKIEPIRFRDEAINKIKKEHYNFNKKVSYSFHLRWVMTATKTKKSRSRL